MSHFRNRYRFAGGRFSQIFPWPIDHPDDTYWTFVQKYPREVIAVTAQVLLEEVTTSFVLHWVKETNCRSIALAGGVFANVKLNQRLMDHPNIDHIWIAPNMGDGGLAVGGILAHCKPQPRQITDVFWEILCVGLISTKPFHGLIFRLFEHKLSQRWRNFFRKTNTWPSVKDEWNGVQEH